MAGIRSFLALELSLPARRAAAAVASALRERPRGDAVRWVRPEGFHVTLRFLGDIDPERVDTLVRAVETEVRAHESFSLRLGPVTGFPTPRRPRVIVIELEPGDPVAELALAVERGVAAAGIAPEREARRFRAHLTIGRVKGRAPALVGVPRPEAVESEVNEVVLFRSQLRPSGAVYTPLERIALADSNHPSIHSLEDGRHGKEA